MILLPADNQEKQTVGTEYQEFKETLEMMSSLENNLSSSVSMEVFQIISSVGFEVN